MPSSYPALLIIDVQKAIDDPTWGRRNNADAEKRMQDLLERWRTRGWPIVHVRHHSREADSTYRPGQRGCEFKPEVQPLPGEKIVTKQTNNAFVDTELDSWLRLRHIESVVICGVITNNSVEASARMAGNLGYRTIVVSDATATFDKVDYCGRHRTAGEVHAMSLANLDGEYARVISSVQLLQQIDMQPPVECSDSLDRVRANIDRVDRQIVALLAQRGGYVKDAARFKTDRAAVKAPDRVEQVIAKVTALALELDANPAIVERVYRVMIEAFIAAELEEHAAIRRFATPPR
jgi:nicotinamidase-related amidase/chorismate mutase